jgi:competence protein ComEA
MPDETLLDPDEPRPEKLDRSALWLERLADLRARWTLGQVAAGAVLAVGVLVAAVAFLRPAGAPPPTELSLPMASSASSTTETAAASSGGAGPSVAPAELVVHAAGAVVAPGLYRLKPGSRVADLIAAAGGLRPDADADRVNLAAPLHDGERVAVPRIGEPGTGTEGAAPDATSEGPLDLNTATAAQFDALPGVGPATAQAIVADRERNGPFRSVDDLLRVRGIGPAKLDQIRGLVTV